MKNHGKIKFDGGYYNFPLKITEVLYKLPLQTVILAFLSFSYHQIKNFIRPTNINNSEDFLIKNYGQVLYEIFFKSYIEMYCDYYKISEKKFNKILEKWVNKKLFKKDKDIWKPIFKNV